MGKGNFRCCCTLVWSAVKPSFGVQSLLVLAALLGSSHWEAGKPLWYTVCDKHSTLPDPIQRCQHIPASQYLFLCPSQPLEVAVQAAHAAFSSKRVIANKNLKNKLHVPSYKLHIRICALHWLLRSEQKGPASDRRNKGCSFPFLSFFFFFP